MRSASPTSGTLGLPPSLPSKAVATRPSARERRAPQTQSSQRIFQHGLHPTRGNIWAKSQRRRDVSLTDWAVDESDHAAETGCEEMGLDTGAQRLGGRSSRQTKPNPNRSGPDEDSGYWISTHCCYLKGCGGDSTGLQATAGVVGRVLEADPRWRVE